VYFYPKDNTPGCTKEACSFRDRYEDFKDLGCEVFGISSDDAKSHQTFSTQYNLPFSLLSDSDQKVRKAFEVPTNLFGLLPGRVTYIIDLKGKIQGIYNSQTQPVKHITQALDKVKSMIA
jgi:peroxiredoxin Q/BCP